MKVCIIAAAGLLSFVAAGNAEAALIININQVGTDVVATALGTLDLTGLTAAGGAQVTPYVYGTRAAVLFGNSAAATVYTGLTGTVPNFGNGGQIAATSTTGSLFGITNSASGGGTAGIGISSTFVSGGAISATDIFASSTLATLGLRSGTYTYMLPHDTITINIGTVPEPASWAMMIGGFGMVGAAMRLRRRRTAPFA